MSNTMSRGVQQALYKYLPGSWVDFTRSGGGTTYAVHVDNWNSVQLTGINNKRLLRIINQHVQNYIANSNEGSGAVIDFASSINEETYDVLTPKISDTIGAIQTTVKPWVFVCSSCGSVRQYYTYEEFKRREHEPCTSCKKHMTQLRMIRFCKCGYADGIYVPKCPTPDHGTKHIVRRGSGVDFVCTKCGKKVPLNFGCPECHQKLEIKPALDSSHYIPFNLSLIDLVDKRKDVFLENEANGRGERVVIANYLGLLQADLYDKTITIGRITEDDEFESLLQKEAQEYKLAGLDDATIAIVIDAKRRTNPNGIIFESIAKVEQGLTFSTDEELTGLAEEILEYDELVHAKVVLSMNEAELDAEKINDGIRPDYISVSKELGFSSVQLCSGVPIISCAYGYTRKERSGEGVKLRGFPREMEKRNVYAAKLETEGVLFELDRRKIIEWMMENGFISSQDAPDEDEFSEKKWFLDRVKKGLITPFNAIDDTEKTGQITSYVYKLIHSVSHALIDELAQICGLDKSSLSEYILPNIPAVFIYCSNSQGYSMGAIYNAFQAYFDRWMRHAKENSRKCIFDPICINHDKACAGCLYLNEVSCQHFNKDLDRSYLCGHYDVGMQKKTHGFWEN